MKLNGTHQFLVYADDFIILGRSVLSIMKNKEVLIVASKEENADKTKYMIMPRDQNAGQNHRTKTDNSSFEKAEHLKYMGTTLTNQNYIQEEIKSRSNSENACYLSMQNLSSSNLLLIYTEL